MANNNSTQELVAQSPTLTEVVHIRVVEHSVKKDFYISEDLLQRKASLFAEIIHRRDDPGICFEITDFNIETFSIFMAWLNTRRENHLHRDPLGGHYFTSYMPLAKLYIFACYYQIPQLDEHALCRFVSLIHSIGGKERISSTFGEDIVILPTLEEIDYIYENTASDSPLRPIVVEAFCVADEGFNYSLMKCNTEFLVDVIMHMRNNQGNLKILTGSLDVAVGQLVRRRKRKIGGVEFRLPDHP